MRDLDIPVSWILQTQQVKQTNKTGINFIKLLHLCTNPQLKQQPSTFWNKTKTKTKTKQWKQNKTKKNLARGQKPNK